MLPVENFVEVVSFLGYYDLGGLKLANKLFSDVSIQCAQAIRLFDFSNFSFYIHGSWIYVHRLGSNGLRSCVCRLDLTSEKSVADFITEAFRNCVVGRLDLGSRDRHVLHAIRAVADSVLVADTLAVDIEYFEDVQKILEYVDSFRQVKSLTTWLSYRMTLDERTTLKNWCQLKNISLHFL